MPGSCEVPTQEWRNLTEPPPRRKPAIKRRGKLPEGGASFTALLSFNDISAIGAMRAFRDAGPRVAHDVSVVG
jgi:hypothetical protein